ncbi:N-acetylmuramoyl-L-alanine amidase [Bacillus thuringiensis]|uniref:N-acetylmuramoyl-L-alanine amidase n=2 Tax=Bacillus thuringiensis TaxID=1428 RepID=A0ABD6SAK8_BACTU|nr:GH25 family lysozyme [Bacillus thuringiensis]PER42734.1 N-acetylmuramoyl-L-alanine amidase [Bacillus thuringiensis]PEU90948.1 N-acetylmuramoyl-L-alanine amidase [Bacillus thuringiensis]PFI07403.1 N-acetylmuramoyl-L-alanine amidase [Bacillus thuringiensis]PFW25154.1 N-acetylmuramoyl-L-alanine amidase [Bacillus thuringiensis]PGY62169.1 N-acetylmuramoyl-L-alanine amidase [Bacillus thuringiensis]
MGYIVDLSKWNNKMNWPVAAPQIELAICRVQYGSNLVDHLYNDHVANLERYGIPHAAYAYGCFVSVADAIVEAKDFLARVNPNAKFLVLDVEDDTVKSMKSKGNLNDLAKASQAFIDTCKAAGWKVGFYVAHHMYGDYNLQSVQADFIWLPRYGTNDGSPQRKPSYPCDIWQYTDNGYIDGIGKVDINLIQGNKTLDWFTGDKQTEQAITNGGYQYVKSGGFGISLVQEVLNVMAERGTKGKVISDPSTGIAYLQTEVLPNGELDKITAWMDNRPEGKWFYEYIKVK